VARKLKITVGDCVRTSRVHHGVPFDIQPGRVVKMNPDYAQVVWARGAGSSWVARRHLARVRCDLYVGFGSMKPRHRR